MGGVMIKTDIKVPVAYTNDDIRAAVASHIPVRLDELSNFKIIKSNFSNIKEVQENMIKFNKINYVKWRVKSKKIGKFIKEKNRSPLD